MGRRRILMLKCQTAKQQAADLSSPQALAQQMAGAAAIRRASRSAHKAFQLCIKLANGGIRYRKRHLSIYDNRFVAAIAYF
jgi:hypothetical protein